MRSQAHYLAVSVLVAALATAAWCGVADDERLDDEHLDDEHFFENFLTAVTTAPEDGYDVYWLGREFEAAGLTFRGPYMADFAATFTGGGISVDYGPDVADDDPRRFVTIGLALYSPAAWEQVGQSLLNRPNFQGQRRSTQVAGQDAELFISSRATRPVHSIRVYVFTPGTTVRLSTNYINSGINPLLDEEVFLSIVEQLRPYPE